MFDKWFGKKDTTPTPPKAPEILGLFLGGSFTVDPLRLRLVEPELLIEGAASTQIIQSVGVVKLDEHTTILRFYTDDDGFLQVLLNGGMQDQNVADVKLWYFYETKAIGRDWDQLLAAGISTPEVTLEGQTFRRVWEGAGEDSPAVAITEKTYHLDGSLSETDQFVMLYERQAAENLAEYLTYTAEERIVDNRPERCFVISTGFDLSNADLRAN
jgi:hypothetical protein